MGIFSLFSSKSRRDAKASKKKQPSRGLMLESLEDRLVPATMADCPVISGYVYTDTNNNGLKDPGELPIANTPIQLRNSANVVVGSTTTDANGYYEFAYDSTIAVTPATLTKTVSFPTTQTDFSLQGLVDQFDPSLGQLQSIEIQHSGSITSEIKVENTSGVSASTITGTVGGKLTLTGPGGINQVLTLAQNVGSANLSIYDNNLDFGGNSGFAFGSKTANGSATITLTGAQMNAFIGTGKVTLTETSNATSNASGNGNLVVQIASTGTASVKVIYKYLPNNCLKPGNYTIIETQQPPGLLDGKESSNGVVLNNPSGVDKIPVVLGDVDNVNNNFGELPPPSISGYVYVDANDNGFKEGGETPLSGVTIALSGIDDLGASVNKTTTTNGSGFYEFKNLRPGTYSVTETQPSSHYDGKDTAGSTGGQVTNDKISNIVLDPADQSVNNNFGELPPSTISGYVYFDENDNGIKDPGEDGISGVTVKLGGAANKTTTTNASGFYQFANLAPGVYTLTETQPNGYSDGKDTVGSLGGQTGNDVFTNVSLPGGASGQNYNFGERPLAGLSGYVYNDSNNNGIKDPGEAGIPGAQVNLGGAANKSTTTDAAGFYDFTDLAAGTYTITETQPAGYADGKDKIGSQGGSMSNDFFSNITLEGGEQGINNNFGELKGSSLSGYAYVDNNNNGIKDPGEVGIAGVSISLSGADDLGPVSKNAITDGTGFYQFANLRPGNYQINEAQPSGYLDGKDAIGSQGGTTGNDVLSNISLGANVQGVNNNFGEVGISGLSGYVYVDANNNGTKDPGETPIAGASVALTGNDDNGAVNKTATTDAAGFYQFVNLRPGTYNVHETQPAAYLDGKDAVGTLGGNLGNDNVTIILVAQNANGVNYNFGELNPAKISGFVYADKNESSSKDAGDGAIANVTVTLTGSNDQGGVNLTTTTDGTGFYQFTNLRPGTYTVTETQPSNYDDGQDNVGSLGGNMSNDQLSGIVVTMGANGQNYNFGELLQDNADIGVTKAVDQPSVLVGSNFTYTLTITNYGTFVANQVVVKDTLPPEVTYVSSFGPPGWTITRAGNLLTATTASLPVGASATITITVKAPLFVTTLTNNVTVTSITPDKNPLNNTATVQNFVYNQPGQTFPSTIKPLETVFKPITIIGKGPLIDIASGGGSTVTLISKANATFIDGIYRTLTGKPVDATTLLAQLKKMANGTMTREQLVAQLWNSDAHRAMQADALYKTFLDRAPNATEKASTIASLKAGVTETQLAQQLLTSAAYLQAHPNSLALVAGIYGDVTGAIPDLASLMTTAQALAVTPWSSFVQTTLNSTASLTLIVTEVYHATVRRDPTGSEIASWIAQLQSGTTPGQFAQTLLASNEFYQLALSVVK